MIEVESMADRRTAGFWMFGVKNRRDCWTPAAMTTTAFLDISIRRCQAAIRSSAFAVLLYACEILFCLGWIYDRKSHEAYLRLGTFLTSPLLLAVSICTVACSRVHALSEG